MDYLIISIVTLIGAGLTLFSGFGLGTLLLPVFGLFFPIDIAIGLTALVHFSNNLIKFGFYYKHVNWHIVIRFGVPAIIAAFIGAYLLIKLTHFPALFSYSITGKVFVITPIKLTIASLLLIFASLELIPALSNIQFNKKYMSVGGMISGFFGGLSGHQGALRSAFLIRSGLNKEVFIGTGVVIACVIDLARISIYSGTILNSVDEDKIHLLLIAVVSAFIGVYLGNKWVKKITIKALQLFVALMLVIFSLFLGSGII